MRRMSMSDLEDSIGNALMAREFTGQGTSARVQACAIRVSLDYS